MKSALIIVFAVINVFNRQGYCQSDLSDTVFEAPVDYDTACGEPFDGEFPWLVKIHELDNTGTETKKFKCNGNIIDKYTVLTTARCVTSHGGGKINPRKLSAEVGKIKFMSGTEKTKEYTVRAVVVHHGFNVLTNENDIAILKTINPIEFSSYVHPICLTNDATKFNIKDIGTVPIWTHLMKNSTHDVLNSATIPIEYDNLECIRQDPEFTTQYLAGSSFCAGTPNQNYNLCRGSNGVGLSLIEETRTKYIWYLKGILQIGKLTDDPGVCAGPLQFTDVFKFINWINEIR